MSSLFARRDVVVASVSFIYGNSSKANADNAEAFDSLFGETTALHMVTGQFHMYLSL